jgi:hypothetical protein
MHPASRGSEPIGPERIPGLSPPALRARIRQSGHRNAHVALLTESSPLLPLPRTPAPSGVFETLAFVRDPDFARSRFERSGDVVETSLLGLDPVDRDALFVDFEIWCQGPFSLPIATPGSPFAHRIPPLDAVVTEVMRLTPPVGASSAASGSPSPWGVCPGKAVAELQIRLLMLAVTPSPSPKDGLLVRGCSRATVVEPLGAE